MTAEAFRAMHQSGRLLVLPNVWDAVSARAFAAAGFGALATASTAIAASLGYEDGERTPREDMLAAIARIAGSVDVPVSADIEAGYGLAPGELVDRLLGAGVVGCNLEDSDPRTGVMVDAASHAERLRRVCEAAAGRLVVNARVDVYLHGGGLEQAVHRGRLYRDAGADCVYPIFAPAADLPTLVAETGIPVNVHWQDDGPSLPELAALGVARVTFGGGLHRRVSDLVDRLAATVAAQAAEVGQSAAR